MSSSPARVLKKALLELLEIVSVLPGVSTPVTVSHKSFASVAAFPDLVIPFRSVDRTVGQLPHLHLQLLRLVRVLAG